MSDIPLTEDPAVKAARCRVLEALAGEPARNVIWRACRAFFEGSKTVPLELLYSSKHQERLMSAGSAFLGANQKVAIAQVAGTKQSVSDRLKELNQLTQDWQIQTRAYEAKSDAVASAGQLEALLKNLPGNAAEKQAMTFIAIARMLAPLKDYAQKFEAVMTLEDDPDLETVEILDPLVGEFMRTSAVSEQLLQGLETLEEKLHRIADLAMGTGAAPANLSSTAQRLASWLVSRPMPNAQAALQSRLVGEISGGQSLTGGAPAAELKAVLKLRKRLTVNGQLLGGSVCEAAFDRRCSRLLNPEVIDKIIGPTSSIAQELEAVLPLLDEPIGERAREFIVRMVDQMVQACQSPQRLVGENTPPPQRLKMLARFHKRIRKAELIGAIKTRILRTVETFHADTLKAADPLSRIEQQGGGNHEKALALIDLCRSGMLIPGDYLDKARKAAEARLKSPDFMPGYLGSAQDPTQRAERSQQLKTMLIEVSCPRIFWTPICPTGGIHDEVEHEPNRNQRCE
ncbi:MAG: hypothetical protein FJX60_23965 [Alphaproteobacteria bacterium]|nr:hypothetical protein [Alphaproteobacteria bacterium]